MIWPEVRVRRPDRWEFASEAGTTRAWIPTGLQNRTMDSTDDPFLRFLAAFSGEVIRFCPGRGGLDDAVSSMSFLALCDRLDVTVAGGEDRCPEAMCFFGSDEAAAAACDSRVAVLPSSLTRFEAVGKLARREASLFCRDPRSMRIAELQGVPHDRRRFCRDLACHLDLAAFDLPRGEGEGVLWLDIGDGGLDGRDGDGIAFILSGADDRWRSPERCRDAIQQALTGIGPYATIRTNSPTLAILTSRVGRKAILRIDVEVGYAGTWRARMAQAHPGIAFETDLVEPAAGDAPIGAPLARSRGHRPAGPVPSSPSAIDLKRDLRRATQEREALASNLASLREEFDARLAEEVLAIERDSRGVRLLPARLVEERLGDAEKRVTEAEGRALAAVESAAAERDRANLAAQRLTELQRQGEEQAQHLAALRQREQALVDEAARWEKVARERSGCEAVDPADLGEKRSASSLQNTIAEMTRARQLAESQAAHALTLLKRNEAAKVEADRAASATRDRLDAVLSSTSWRLTRPLRAGIRVLRLLTGSGRRSPRS